MEGEKKLLLVLRLDLPNSVILLLTGPSSAFEKWYSLRRSRFSECRRHEWGGGGGGGGGGTRGG